MKSKRKAGTILVILGCCCLIAAAAFYLCGRAEESSAASESEKLTKTMAALIEKSSGAAESDPVAAAEEKSGATEDAALGLPPEESAETDAGASSGGASAVDVGGYDVAGILSAPDIDLELAVISPWSYKNLRAGPCLYSGSPSGRMILLAHNYSRHFGHLRELQPGASVTFTAADGTVYSYTVTGTEIWAADQLAQVVSGSGWDLTLFTCTIGGANRVVVRCAKAG